MRDLLQNISEIRSAMTHDDGHVGRPATSSFGGGHSATWVLLALSFLVRGSTSHWSSRIANLLAIAALLTYAAFLFTAA